MAPVEDATREENQHFEDEVRRIARQLWPAAQFAGAVVHDGREHDGVFETDECFNALEATTSRRKEKAQTDVNKLVHLAQKLQRKTATKAVRCWFITRDEPTAEQRKVVDKHRPLVTALSFSQFQSLLVDARAYLTARDNYYFGSVRDPATGAKAPSVGFIDVMLSHLASDAVATPSELVAGMQEGKRLVVLGDYGAGKSMTLRHLYHQLRKAYLKGSTPLFPVFVNLRDHYGQTDPAELLERHARIIGFPNPWHLVRAWRAGYVHLLLDGFDEITTLNIQGLWTKLRDIRYRAMEAVRRLARDHPVTAGLAIAGRAHFFDSANERRNALALSGDVFEFSLNEFSDEQVADYLKKSGLSGVVPPWLPSRPLLVAYLASRGLLPDLLADENGEPASGWDVLLDKIASRESQIEAGIDGGTVRRILERLSTKARTVAGGLGPLTPDALIAAFREICGYGPDERGMVLLQRLPGLGVDRDEEGTRVFIDEDFAEACRAGDLVQFINSPYEFESDILGALECATGSLGIAVAARRCEIQRFSAGKVNAAIRRAREVSPGNFAADLARVAIECGHSLEDPLHVRGVFIPDLEFTAHTGNASQLAFQDCFFSRIGIDSDIDANALPKFKGCFIDEVDGRISREDLPAASFDSDCIIESFATPAATTAAVLSLGLPLGTRVVLTILKKLYQRRGAGRKENALFRGLDHRARRLVPAALGLIQHEGLAVPCKRGEDTIWLPDRSAMRRVGKVIAAPTSYDDPLLRAAADLD
ncbi:MAG: NACHT domain-containing protein [Acidobacteriota bacterium]